MHAAYRWLVEEWQWPYAGTLTAVLLLALFPILWSTGGLALALVFLQLPVYMLHQLEEHHRERFRLFVNSLFGSSVDILPRGTIFWVNSLLVWVLFLAVLLLAQYVNLALGLIAVYMVGFNAAIHVVAALARRTYNPGLYSAIVLMVPAAVAGAIEVNRAADPGAGYEILAVAIAVAAHAALLAFGVRRAFALRAATGSVAAVLVGLTAAGALLATSVPAESALAAAAPGESTAAAGSASRRTVLLGLRTRGNIARLARRSANPSSPGYRRFVTTGSFRKRFSASRRDRTRVARFLRRQRGISSLRWSSTRTTLLAIATPPAARRNFCATGSGVPLRGLCLPGRLRGVVRQVSVGERYPLIGGSGASGPNPTAGPATSNNGTPSGCEAARATGAYLPNQLATAYGVDDLRSRGLEGRGIRVATLSSQPVGHPGLGAWGRCVGLPKPRVEGFSMPSASIDTAVPSNETTLDIEALASLAPRLQQITPIFVPLDVNFSHSFSLFMLGTLDRSAQSGRLPHLLSISDGVCEPLFSSDQLRLGQHLLREASALGITALAASGDAGFLGCEGGGSAASFPNSSRWVTGVGGTDLDLDPENQIADQVVWSTFATAGPEAVGTGGGPSGAFGRPSFQRAPGIGPKLETGKPTRLTPDVAAMASFMPGIATYNKQQGGWGADGGTSAATPLTAAMVALTLEQELDAGRGRLGSLPPLLYRLARGNEHGSIFYDVTKGTSSRKPSTPAGMTPAGGAAQPGYDLATGLGSLDATAFADALAAAGSAEGD